MIAGCGTSCLPAGLPGERRAGAVYSCFTARTNALRACRLWIAVAGRVLPSNPESAALWPSVAAGPLVSDTGGAWPSSSSARPSSPSTTGSSVSRIDSAGFLATAARPTRCDGTVRTSSRRSSWMLSLPRSPESATSGRVFRCEHAPPKRGPTGSPAAALRSRGTICRLLRERSSAGRQGSAKDCRGARSAGSSNGAHPPQRSRRARAHDQAGEHVRGSEEDFQGA